MTHMSNYLFYVVPIAAVFPFLASMTIFLQTPSQKYLIHVAFFLFVNLILDTTTGYLALHHINTVVLNNLDNLLVISFYLFLLREIAFNKKAKRVMLGFLIIYPVLSLINLLFVQPTSEFQSMTYALGCLLIVSFCIYYFWELFQQKTSVQLTRQPAFWICSGLLFYYACTFPVYGLINFVNSLPTIILQNLFQILILLNIFLYSSFTIAFLCRLKIRRSM